jgi:hypothetical protein
MPVSAGQSSGAAGIGLRPFVPAQATADEWRDYHAHVNAAMLAVNRRLGYVQYKDARTYQISLERILAALAARVARPA